MRYWEITNHFDSLGPSDTIRWHGSGSTLVQVIACCLTTPSHYQNQRWHIINGLSFILYQFHRKCLKYHFVKWFWKYTCKIISTSIRGQWVNSSPPRGAYMCQRTGSALVQVMACRLSSAKPSPEPILTYSQLDPSEQISLKFNSIF